ncbi:MAG: S1C family serine protease [Mycobacteriales bacterium]
MTQQYEPWWIGPESYQPYEPPAPPKRGLGTKLARGLTAAGMLAAALLGAGLAHAFWPRTSGFSAAALPVLPGISGGSPSGSTGAGPNSSAGTAGPAGAASIAQRVAPAVVDINTTIGYQQAQAAGTGMVLTSTGEILTNNHVITGATAISVTDVGNSRTYRARVLGYDRSADVAVLQLVGAKGLRTVRTANSAAVEPGAAVVAVGNAGGTGGAPSYAGGSITALNQSITASDAADGASERLSGLLETNANVVPGDSGGPLVNTSGQVIGMDTAAATGFSFQSPSSAGFAIPINEALGIARRIVSGQSSATIHIGPTAFLGVSVQTGSGGTGYGFAAPSASGALIAGVVSGTPAANAGLVAGDTITSVAGQQVVSAQGLTRIILAQRPGATVSITYLDPSGQQHTVSVQLASGPPQ